jgi:hypothetical protein
LRFAELARLHLELHLMDLEIVDEALAIGLARRRLESTRCQLQRLELAHELLLGALLERCLRRRGSRSPLLSHTSARFPATSPISMDSRAKGDSADAGT